MPVSGFLLSGGFGWNSGAWGPACVNVLGLEIVTPDGRTIVADADHHADLYWAARGAGAGFFGVVIRYRLQLHPLPPAIRTSSRLYTREELPSICSEIPALAKRLPPSVELTLIAFTRPEDARPVLSVSATAFAGSEDEARRWLAPLEELTTDGCLDRVSMQETPFDVLHESLGSFFPVGHRYAADVFWSEANPGEILGRVQDQLAAAPSARSLFLIAIPPPPPPDAPSLPDMALSGFGSAFVAAYGVWSSESDDPENVRWLERVRAALASVTTGHYVGESDLEASPDRARRCYSESAWQRLRELRSRYDPGGRILGFPGDRPEASS